MSTVMQISLDFSLVAIVFFLFMTKDNIEPVLEFLPSV